MEKTQTIEQYIAAETGGQVVRKRNSPLLGILLLVIGAGLMALLINVKMADSLQTATLTVSAITAALGLLFTAMNISGAMWHYVYAPTGSRLKDHKAYLAVADYQRCLDAIERGDTAALSTLSPVVSSNCALRVLYSIDGAMALLQAGRYETSRFEEETPVVCLVGTEVAAIEALCR